jgi:hypothetical protein
MADNLSGDARIELIISYDFILQGKAVASINSIVRRGRTFRAGILNIRTRDIGYTSDIEQSTTL